jgi:hypothetical protein
MEHPENEVPDVGHHNPEKFNMQGRKPSGNSLWLFSETAFQQGPIAHIKHKSTIDKMVCFAHID